jgi:hypothetical protein
MFYVEKYFQKAETFFNTTVENGWQLLDAVHGE